VKSDDPVSRRAARAIEHLNDDHDDALLEMAQALGGCPEATAARCVDADRTGLDLLVMTPAGERAVRVDYDEPIDEPQGLRKATVKLAQKARAELGREARPVTP
jgi:heme oxygenase (biliverdin-IX-beta and delta-forming)